jgi:hypothetical protein
LNSRHERLIHMKASHIDLCCIRHDTALYVAVKEFIMETTAEKYRSLCRDNSNGSSLIKALIPGDTYVM